jgi:hypothetical protein
MESSCGRNYGSQDGDVTVVPSHGRLLVRRGQEEHQPLFRIVETRCAVRVAVKGSVHYERVHQHAPLPMEFGRPPARLAAADERAQHRLRQRNTVEKRVRPAVGELQRPRIDHLPRPPRLQTTRRPPLRPHLVDVPRFGQLQPDFCTTQHVEPVSRTCAGASPSLLAPSSVAVDVERMPPATPPLPSPRCRSSWHLPHSFLCSTSLSLRDSSRKLHASQAWKFYVMWVSETRGRPSRGARRRCT